MCKANENFRVLAKALYNTKSFRICAKVLYFSRPIVFPSHVRLYIEGAGNHDGGCLECDSASSYY